MSKFFRTPLPFWRRIGRLGGGAIVYAVFLCILTVLEHVVAEKHALTTLLAYIPQWPFAVPIAVYFVLALLKRRRKVIFLTLVMALFWAVSLGDIRLGWGALAPKTAHAFRVLTWNIHHDQSAIKNCAAVIQSEQPDVLCLQEANTVIGYPQVWQMLQKEIPNYQFIAAGDLAIAVKTTPERPKPIVLWKYRPLKVAGWRNHLLEAVVEIDGRKLTVFTAHFDRFARPQSLNALKHRDMAQLNSENQSRARQATDTLIWIAGRTTPDFIFTGDLNTPPHGIVYRRFTQIAQDAYATSALPWFGYSFPSDYPQIRIDHIFCSENLRPQSAHIPMTTASDHRPIVADIGL
jgi:endonuclease/exonuclease/phosphatase (EEP) superfamily protein YafD